MTHDTKTNAGRRSPALRAAKLVAIAVLPFSLGACKTLDQGPEVAGWSLIEGSQRHPIMVSQQPSVLNVHVARGSNGLLPRQRGDVMDFASRFRAGDAGNSRIVIAAPSGASNEVDAMAAVDEARELLIGSGFAETSVAVEAYHAEGTKQPPVRISYMRYVAEGPECGTTWSHDPNRDSKNLPSPNFACATQRNLAAMIANPADLLGPRSETARDSSRRDKVHEGYIAGESTGAKRSDDERVNTRGN